MKKIININKLVTPEEYGINVTDEVTIYPVNNFFAITSGFDRFENAQDLSDLSAILRILFDEKDLEALATIKGLDVEMASTIIRAALNYSMNKEDITETELEGNEDTEGDELPN